MSLERRIFLVFIAALPLARPINFRVAGLLVTPADVLFAATVAVWLLNLARGRASIRFNSFCLVLAAYFTASCLSATAPESPARTAAKLAGIAYLVSLPILTINLVRSWRFFRMVMNAWLVGTAITVAAGVAGALLFTLGFTDSAVVLPLMHGYGSLPPGDYPRIRGLFFTPNMLCNYLNVSLMFMFVMVAVGWLSLTRAWILGLATSITAMLSVSAGIGAMFLSAGLWFWLRDTGRQRVRTNLTLAIAIVLALGVAIVSVTYPDARGHTRDGRPSIAGAQFGVGPRVFVWQSALRTFLDHPVLGRGTATAPALFIWVDPSGRTQRLTDAHNVWLSIAAQQGLVGLAAFLLVVGYVLRRSWASRHDNLHVHTIQRGLGIAFATTLFYQGMFGSFEDARYLWVLMGLIVCGQKPVHAAT